MSELPGAGGAAPPPGIFAANGEGPPDDSPGAAAARQRDEATAERDQNLRAIAETEKYAQYALDHADEARERVQAAYDAAMAHADQIQSGEG